VGRPRFPPDRDEHRRLLTDFVAAARDGDLPRLESLLRADVVAWSDGGGRARAARRAPRARWACQGGPVRVAPHRPPS